MTNPPPTPAAPSTLQSLRALHSLIGESLKTIEDTYAAHKLDFPCPDAPFRKESPEEALRFNSEVTRAAAVLVAAADQLIANVRDPAATVMEMSCQFILSAAFRTAEKANVAEIIREGDPAGVHVDEIGRKSGMEPSRAGRILRNLATYHLFHEVSPNTFVNNRLSSVIDTGKTNKAILTEPSTKYENTDGIAALCAHFADDTFKSAAYLPEALTDPKTAKSLDPTQTAFNRAFNTDKTYFSFIEEPENAPRLLRFGMAMKGQSSWESPSFVIDGFPWNDLPNGSKVVDVGGGVGQTALVIAKNFPNLKLVVQDRPAVCAHGEKMYQADFPEALEDGRVVFQTHDFFQPQRVSKPAVFHLRTVLHDWAEPLAIQILTHLRHAAGPQTKLVIVDMIVPHVCEDTRNQHIKGARKSFGDAPLLPNLGRASSLAYWVDTCMAVYFNSQDRTLFEYDNLTRKAGWKIVEAHLVEENRFGHLIAEPIDINANGLTNGYGNGGGLLTPHIPS